MAELIPNGSWTQTSYETTTGPRRRANYDGPSHFAIIEREGQDPDDAPSRSVNRCRRCPAESAGMILHPDPESSDPLRTICGTCQGEANARRCGIQTNRDGGT